MKLVWVSDLHLNFLTEAYPGEPTMRTLSETKVKAFCDAVLAHKPEAVVITGDITEAKFIDIHLAWLSQYLDPLPIYFVLGNHDFYHGSIERVREFCKQFDGSQPDKPTNNLRWLNVCDVVQLTEKTALVGHDGWYDGQYANWFAPGVVIMNDYYIIKEFQERYAPSGNMSQSGMVQANGDPRIKTFALMQELANQCAFHALNVLPKACAQAKNVIFATHVAPWPQNSVYNGQRSDFKWLPNFSSKLCGDALLEVGKSHPNNEFTILCGHSHGSAEYHPLKNMVSHTRYALYKFPEKSIKVIEID